MVMKKERREAEKRYIYSLLRGEVRVNGVYYVPPHLRSVHEGEVPVAPVSSVETAPMRSQGRNLARFADAPSVDDGGLTLAWDALNMGFTDNEMM